MATLKVTNIKNESFAGDQLYLKTDGTLGLGTTSPAFPSGGGLEIYNSSVPRLKLTNSTSGTAAGDGSQIYLSSSDLCIDHKESGNIKLYTAGVTKATLDASGHLGLGITPSDIDSIGKALNIASSNGGAIYLQDTDSPTTKFAAITYNGSTTQLQIHAHHSSSYIDLGTNGTSRLRIDNNGKVLIATTTTSEAALNNDELIIGSSSDDANHGLTIVTPNDHYGTVAFSDGSGGTTQGLLEYNHDGDYMRIYTAAGERLRIDSGGDVLVGLTTTPSGNGTNLWVSDGTVARLGIEKTGTGACKTTIGAGSDRAFNVYNETADHEIIKAETDGDVQITTGNLIIGTSGKGIDFSATGGPASGTGGSELLDDYEEGTFSPGWFDDGGNFVTSYSTQYGQYTKIGNVVYFCFGLRIGTFSRTPNADQICRVGNLPYASRTVGDDEEVGFTLYARLWGSGTPPKHACVRQATDSNHVDFYMEESQAGNDHILRGEDFDSSATCRVIVSGFYYTS